MENNEDTVLKPLIVQNTSENFNWDEETNYTAIAIDKSENQISDSSAASDQKQNDSLNGSAQLVDANSDVNAIELVSSTRLLEAAKEGNIKAVRELIAAGTEVNVKDAQGKTPLHYACQGENGNRTADEYTNLVKILLEKEARVNDVDNCGATALHLAAGQGNMEIIQLLIDKDALVNVIDSKGETPIHKAVRRKCLELESILLLVKAGANIGIENKSGVSAATLILRLSNGENILRKILDECIGNAAGNEPNEVWLKFRFPVFSVQTEHKMQVIKDLMSVQNQEQTNNLFQHPIIELYLDLKWQKAKYFFYSNFVLYFLFILGISIYTQTEITSLPSSGSMTSLNGSSNDSPLISQLENMGKSTFQWQYFLLIIGWNIFVLEVNQFIVLRLQYLCQKESYIKLIILIASIVLIFLPSPWPEWAYHVSAFTVLIGWAEVTFQLGRLPSFGVYALMFYSVAKHMLKFIIVYLFFLIGFAFSFQHVFYGKRESLDSILTSLLNIFAMMLGDIEYDKYMSVDKHNLNGTAQLIYFTFLILVPLVLMNLLIGLAVNDIQELQKKSRILVLCKKAEFIVYLEDVATSCFFSWLLRLLSIESLWNSWFDIDPDLTVDTYGKIVKSGQQENSSAWCSRVVFQKIISPDPSPRVLKEAKAIIDARKLKNNSESKKVQ